MPSINDKSTVSMIARIFCANGRNKEKALLEAEYSKAYARSKGMKLYEDKRLIDAIAKIDAKTALKQQRTVESLDQMYQQAYDLGDKCKQPAAMNGSVTGIARLYGMDKDAGSGEKTIIIISPKPDRKPVVSKEIENEQV